MISAEFPIINDQWGRKVRLTINDDGTIDLSRVTSGRTPIIDNKETLTADSGPTLRDFLNANIQ